MLKRLTTLALEEGFVTFMSTMLVSGKRWSVAALLIKVSITFACGFDSRVIENQRSGVKLS